MGAHAGVPCPAGREPARDPDAGEDAFGVRVGAEDLSVGRAIAQRSAL